MRRSRLAVLSLMLAACKTTGDSSTSLKAADTIAPPSSGPQVATTNGKAYPLDDQKVTDYLPLTLTEVMRNLQKEAHAALKCNSIPSESINQGFDCTLRDPVTMNALAQDNIQCYELYSIDFVGNPEKIKAEADASCTIVGITWPQVSPGLSALLASEIGRIQGLEAHEYRVGGTKTLTCSDASGAWACRWDGFKTSPYEIEIPFSVPKNMPAATVEAGAKDDFERPLPAKADDYTIRIGDAVIAPRRFKASEDDLQTYVASLDAETRAKINGTLDDYRSVNPDKIPKKCREGELKALLDYTADGYKIINTSLRALTVDGKIDGAAPSPALAARLKAAISALNCAKHGSAEVTARGAKLSAKKLERYVVGKTVVEPAFTSTTIGSQVLAAFQGNTSFYVIKAKGADLSGFSSINPESEAEGEILIQAGALFKVGARDVVKGKDEDGKPIDITRIFLLPIK